MRFSIRWLLAVTAYIALAAAAIGTGHPVLVDCVWCVTLLAICYAAVVAVIDRGKRQALAIGFVVLAGAHLVTVLAAPEHVPAMRLYSAAGYYVESGSGRVYETTSPTTAAAPFYQRANYRPATGFIPDPRTANAVVTLLAGFIGCAIGALAYRRRWSE